MAICKTDAIVTKKFDFRETSIIVEFFTRDFGKMRGILKGIRKDPKKFASTVEAFSYNEIIFYQKRNSDLHLVSQCDLKDDFLNLRDDLKKIHMASFLMELTTSLMAPEDRNEEVFDLVLSALGDLSQSTDPARIITIAQIKLLKLSGFKPHFDSCVLCDSEIDRDSKFSTAFGGMLCSKCAYRDNRRHSVLQGTVASIKHIEKADWQNSQRLGLNAKVKTELEGMLNRFVSFHLEKKLKTARFL